MDCTTDDDADDYGYFCTETENENDFKMTQVPWKQYDEDTHNCVFSKKNLSESDIESIYTNFTDYCDELHSQTTLKKSISSMYMSMLRFFYCTISYITIFIYKVRP